MTSPLCKKKIQDSHHHGDAKIKELPPSRARCGRRRGREGGPRNDAPSIGVSGRREGAGDDAHSALVLPFLSDASKAAALMDEDRHQDRQRRNDDIEMDAGPFDGEIWKCRDEKWSCRVSGALLRGCYPSTGNDALWGACSSLASESVPFASLILPGVVYDVVCARAGDSAKGRKAARDLARDALSDHLSDALLTNNSNSHLLVNDAMSQASFL